MSRCVNVVRCGVGPMCLFVGVVDLMAIAKTVNQTVATVMVNWATCVRSCKISVVSFRVRSSNQ
jgi:hypothetical protein